MVKALDLAVIGGGASGFFTALQYAEFSTGKTISIFEKGSHFLQKVRISGGGRCNVTHACFDPRELVKHYPRGARELLASFHRWQPRDTISWFERCGVTLKAEPDGRMFPTSNSSETVIQCFMEQAQKHRIDLRKNCQLLGIEPQVGGGFLLYFERIESPVEAKAICLATGSLKASPLLRQLESHAQPVIPLVPSLFAFNVVDPRLEGLAGVSHPLVAICLEGSRHSQRGPLLITHRGVSGPAVLRLSAWEAREMAALRHHFRFTIDWLPEMTEDALRQRFAEIRQHQGAKLIRNTPISPISRRLWERLVECSGISPEVTWGQLSKSASLVLFKMLKSSCFEAGGKTTNQDEFVTAGGIDRKSIDFRTMESRVLPGLFVVGECLDVDGITGGFNFQAAWTTAHLAAQAIAAR